MKYFKLILAYNYIIFFINIILLLLNKPIFINLKNVDLKVIYFNFISYNNISYYLNNKYSINNQAKKDNNTKKQIQLYFIDFFYSSYRYKQINIIKKILSQKFDIQINPHNPEYLIYNVFGCLHIDKKYNKSIKIAYYTENQLPDFNIADYAIGQAHFNYLDRYYRIPYIIGLSGSYNNSKMNLIRQLVINKPIRKKFCAVVISNNNSYAIFRLNFIKELNKYKKVDMGGIYNNNVGKIKNKILFLSSYKFSIAMENSEGDGYMSEKIIDSFISGTIPIYYGNYMIDEYINPKSYIHIRGEKDMKEKIEYIKKKDDNLYKKILKENILIDNKFKEKIENQKIQLLINKFEQDINKARRIDTYQKNIL